MSAEEERAKALALAASVVELPAAEQKERRLRKQKLGFTTDNNGRPIANTDNCARLIGGDESFDEFRPWFDRFTQRRYRPDGGQWSDGDTLRVQQALQSRFDMPRVSRGVVEDACGLVSFQRSRDTAHEWAETCAQQWDGVPRIARLLDDVFSCGVSDYTLAVSSNLFLSIAARILNPGCKSDTMTILESEQQGIGKSSFCRALVPEQWFGVVNRSPDDPKFVAELQGKLVLELAEMATISRADQRRIKSVLSVQSDYCLLPYAHSAIDLPRRCTFIGTTNMVEYLSDETGNRRFLPVRCKKTRPVGDLVAHIEALRAHLIGEAVRAVLSGSPWHELPASAADEQQERMEHDSWMDILADWNGELVTHRTSLDRFGFVLAADILHHGLGIEVGRQTRGDRIRLGAVLHRLGWRRVKVRHGGATVWAWSKQ